MNLYWKMLLGKKLVKIKVKLVGSNKLPQKTPVHLLLIIFVYVFFWKFLKTKNMYTDLYLITFWIGCWNTVHLLYGIFLKDCFTPWLKQNHFIVMCIAEWLATISSWSNSFIGGGGGCQKAILISSTPLSLFRCNRLIGRLAIAYQLIRSKMAARGGYGLAHCVLYHTFPLILFPTFPLILDCTYTYHPSYSATSHRLPEVPFQFSPHIRSHTSYHTFYLLL